MGNYTKLTDTLSSTEGSVYLTIDGQNRPGFEMSSTEATIELIVQEKRLLGHRMTQHKVVGGKGTGSGTFYFMNSEMLNKFHSYKKNGKFPEISMQILNEDPQSTIGRQNVALRNVIFANIPVAKLDDSSEEDPITFDSDYTFDDYDVLESFELPENYK
ncbi:MAG: phage tail tube protein [Candidatus Avilachnospira sp.]|jgi:hypothetical protein